MAAPAPSIRDIEHTLKASGLTRVQAKKALHYMKVAGILDAILPQGEPERGIFGTIKNAFGRK